MAKNAPAAAKPAPAKKPGKTVTTVKPAGTSLANIDSELNNEVASLKERLGQSEGRKITVEPKGNFVLPDGAELGDEIKVIVIDFASRNNYYSTPFDKDNPTPPDCYAMGRDIAKLVPEADSPDIQNPEGCRTCWANQFQSAANKKGKACSNRRLLAVLIVDPNDPDAHNDPEAPIYVLDVAPTSNRSFDGAAAAIARSLAGPPIKAIITVTATSMGTYASLSFLSPEPNPDYAAHYARRGECEELLFRRPDFEAAAAKTAKPAGRGTAARRPAGRSGR
jgi:hypothetical protein